jgi:hypothetical protein
MQMTVRECRPLGDGIVINFGPIPTPAPASAEPLAQHAAESIGHGIISDYWRRRGLAAEAVERQGAVIAERESLDAERAELLDSNPPDLDAKLAGLSVRRQGVTARAEDADLDAGRLVRDSDRTLTRLQSEVRRAASTESTAYGQQLQRELADAEAELLAAAAEPLQRIVRAKAELTRLAFGGGNAKEIEAGIWAIVERGPHVEPPVVRPRRQRQTAAV